jgi:hypothetical protein
VPSAALNDSDRELVERVQSRYSAAEQEHKQFRTRSAEFYALYRNLQDFRTNNADRPDRDVMRRAQREWGAELFIPFAYRTVETIVPRMLAHRPKMNPLPEDEQAYGNVDNMRFLLDKQQEQIRYELILQDICKDGLVYGLGVQKVGWKKTTKTIRGIKPGTYGTWVEDTSERCTFDDAWAEWVDPFDFLWDPYGHSVETCDYVFHRTWRSSDYVSRMVKAGHWRARENDPACTWTLEDILSSSAVTKFDEVQQDRRSAEGYAAQREGTHSRRHEVWEFHDGRQVITVLNSEFPVQVGENPMPDGSLPFMVFRPTKVGGRMVGIGEIEPIRDLQYEINTLRGQRRDAATMALGRGYAFDETTVNADDLIIGPNIAIPVNGSPRDFPVPPPYRRRPASGYSEEQAIASDIESTSGISDPVTGGEGNGPASQTATGVQLVQQAAGLRIQNKTRRLGSEIIVPGGDAWVLLNQTKILEPRPVRVPNEDGGLNQPAWTMRKLGPYELRGRMAISMDDGSTMAKNVPQMRQDAQMLQTLAQDPLVDQQKLRVQILENLGIENAQAFLVPQEPQLPASTVEAFLAQMNIPAEALVAFLDQQEAAQSDQAGGAPQNAPEVPQ